MENYGVEFRDHENALKAEFDAKRKEASEGIKF
jgi:hypothetical protein